MMTHCGRRATTVAQDTEVQLRRRPAKMLVPPPSWIRASGMARPGAVKGADCPLSYRKTETGLRFAILACAAATWAFIRAMTLLARPRTLKIAPRLARS